MTKELKLQGVSVTEGEEIFFTHYVEYVDYRLRRFFTKILVAFAILGFCVAGSVVYIAHVSSENQRALCAVKNDNQARINQTNDFLKDHPEGFAGLSAAVLRRSLEGNVRTVKALKDVNCD